MTQTLGTTEAIVAACVAVKTAAPTEFPPDLPPDPRISNVPAWYAFEHSAWPIGESIRQSLSSNPKLKKDPIVLRAILDVVCFPNLRRGRQSFVMALGFSAAVNHAATLAPFMSDPDIGGQVIHTLLKMRAPGFGGQATSLLSHKQAWVRRLAQRYIDRFGVQPNNSPTCDAAKPRTLG